MNIRKIAATGVAVGALVGLVAVAAPATADPVADGYALTGSDTLQDVVNALVNGTTVTGTNVRVTAKGVAIGSYNAFGSPTIQTKAAGPNFARPSGSGAGVDSLLASIPDGSGKGLAYGGATDLANQVDIARSSSGPRTVGSGTASDKLAFIPFARDLVEYAYQLPTAESSACKSNVASLSKAQLSSIYTTVGGVAISGCSTHLQGRLPQLNSGTRKFFTGAIGVDNSAPAAVAADHPNDDTVNGPQENTGAQIADYEIIPFSAGSWIAQTNGAAPNTIAASTPTTSTFALGAIDETGAAYTVGGDGKLTGIESAFDNTTFGRDTYLVVPTAKLSSDPALAALLNTSAATGSLASFVHNNPAQVGSVKLKFGFQAPLGGIKYGNS